MPCGLSELQGQGSSACNGRAIPVIQPTLGTGLAPAKFYVRGGGPEMGYAAGRTRMARLGLPRCRNWQENGRWDNSTFVLKIRRCSLRCHADED
jgi:hypothetical protein